MSVLARISPFRDPALVIPLRNPSFRLLFGGQVISDIGDWLDLAAVSVLVGYYWNLGPGGLAALFIAIALPSALFSSFAGVLADRLPRRTVMVTSDVLRGLVVLGLILAPNIYVLLMLVFLKNAIATFFSPARQSAIRMTVPKEDLLAASSLSQVARQVTKVVGPALGVPVLALFGPHGAFAVDAATFFLSALLLAQLPTLEPPAKPVQADAPAQPKPSFWAELRDGVAYILRNPILRLVIGAMALRMFLLYTYDSQWVLLFRTMGLDETAFSIFLGTIGLGTALSATAVGQWGKRVRPLTTLCLGIIVGGSLIILNGLGGAGIIVAPLFYWIIVWFLMGVAGGAIFVPFGYLMQAATPPEMMGRVSGTTDTIMAILVLASPALGAALASFLSVGAVYLVAGPALILVGGTILLLSRNVANPA